MPPLLLCTDLDRTLLPNGEEPESPGVRDRFSRVAEREECLLAYVTGRHLASVEAAIEEYRLPIPDYAICDVGTSIHARTERSGGASGEPTWMMLDSWHRELGRKWPESGVRGARERLALLTELELQEEERQASFKLSYYTPPETEPDALLQRVRERLGDQDHHPALVYSVDETTGTGLLDLLPPGVGKRSAIEFLLRECGLSTTEALFAGDSGNDLQVLSSPIPAVLVANASADVRERAREEARASGNEDLLYLAQGRFHGMNGNYAAGILEGLAHYRPASVAWWS